MKNVFAASLLGILMSGSNAFAHSDYWRCAVGAGSAGNVAAECGSRDNFDRTGRVGPDNGYGRGGWDRDDGYRGGRRGGRWNLTSVESSVGSCFSQVNGQGEEMLEVTAEVCAAMGGQSFAPVAQ